MMKQLTLGMLFGLAAAIALTQKSDDLKKNEAPKPIVTREYLLAHGFEKSADSPYIFTREHVRLRDVSRDLGFPLGSLCPTLNQANDSDERTVDVQGAYIIVRWEVPERKPLTKPIPRPELRRQAAGLIRRSLDDPDAICSVRVSIAPPPPVRNFLQTDSSPVLRLKSVVIPEERSKPWQVTFQIAASGKNRVAILRGNFFVIFSAETPHRNFATGLLFPKDTPKVITVLPDKPMEFTVEVRYIHLIPAGTHAALQIGICPLKRHDQTVDYEWHGDEFLSDKHEFVAKQSK